eukprot:SAG22_NODE_2605_length_2392_cov_1.633232_2_plen_89_part_00
MYNDDDAATFSVPAADDAEGAPAVELVVRQTLDEEDLCSIFDDAWLGSRVRERGRQGGRAGRAGQVPGLWPGLSALLAGLGLTHAADQ